MNTFEVFDTQVGVAGDWHIDGAWAERSLKNFARAGVSLILHVGDFGFWNNAAGVAYLDKVQSVSAHYGLTVLVTLGNHEDYVMVGEYVSHPDFEGFVYDPARPNIIVATRGVRFLVDGVDFVSLGGANSIDRNSHTEGIDWWREEQISLGDVYRTVQDGHATVMVTHDCPTGVNLFANHRDDDHGWSRAALVYAQQSRDMLRQAVDGVTPEVLFHGHYHRYMDQVTLLNNGVEDYQTRTIGLDMNRHPNNIGIFTPRTQTFTILDNPLR